jgi:hypothetical protein
MGPDGTIYPQNRATLHLHGGNTPWISDGTPHQWITPPGEPASLKKGLSFANAPDMVGAGMPVPAPSDGDGLATFFWPNDQSGRLTFGKSPIPIKVVLGHESVICRAPGDHCRHPRTTSRLERTDVDWLVKKRLSRFCHRRPAGWGNCVTYGIGELPHVGTIYHY